MIEVTEKPFKDLTPTDKQGHEGYTTDEEMYQTYSDYYDTAIGPDTLVKIVRFKLGS